MLVIYNPTAGWRSRHKLRRTLRHLEELDCVCEIAETHARGDAERYAREAASRDDLDLVAVAGGDGTINEAANGLAGSGMALGIIPMGTANVLAHEIGLTPNPRAIARTLAEGPAREIYLGIANGRRFLLMTGVGTDAWVIAHLNLRLKRWISKLAYGMSAGRMLFTPFHGRYRVIADGKSYETGSVLIAKARCYGGPFVLAPDARLSRPSFFVFMLDNTGRLDLIRYGLSLLRGTVGKAAHMRVIETQSLEVHAIAATREESVEGESTQSDGDLVATLPLTVSLDPVPLKLIVPTGATHI